MESQNNQIRNHLLSGKRITPLLALNLFGCFRLSARIHDLRSTGLAIKSRQLMTPEKKRFAEYYIETPKTN